MKEKKMKKIWGKNKIKNTVELIKFKFQILGSTELFLAPFNILISKENPTTCGCITPGIEMKVINPQNGKILQPNETGELCFNSPFMMKEYYKNPVATRKAIDDDGELQSKHSFNDINNNNKKK